MIEGCLIKDIVARHLGVVAISRASSSSSSSSTAVVVVVVPRHTVTVTGSVAYRNVPWIWILKVNGGY